MKPLPAIDQQKPIQHTTQRTLTTIATFAIKYASPGFQVSRRLRKTIQAFFTASDHPHHDEEQSEVDRALKHLKIPPQNFHHIYVPICLLAHLYPVWFESYVTIRHGVSPIAVGLVKSLGGLDGFAIASLQFWSKENHYTLDMYCYPHRQAFHWIIDNSSRRIDRVFKDPSSEWFGARHVQSEAFRRAADLHFVPAQSLKTSRWTCESESEGGESERMRIYLRELAAIASDGDETDQTAIDEENLQVSKADKKREAQRQRRMKKRKVRSEIKEGDLSVADLVELMKQEPYRY